MTATPLSRRHQPSEGRAVLVVGTVVMLLSLMLVRLPCCAVCDAAAVVGEAYVVTTLFNMSTANGGECNAVMESVVNGTILFTLHNNRTLNRLHPNGTVETIAGASPSAGGVVTNFSDGQGTSARFYGPSGLTPPFAEGADRSIYIADRYNHRIRRVNLTTNNVSTLAGNGTASSINGVGTNASFMFPSAIVRFDWDTLYVGELSSGGNNHIRKINITSMLVSDIFASVQNDVYGIAMIVQSEAFVTRRTSIDAYDVYRYTASQGQASSSQVFPTQYSTLRGISVIATTGNTTLLLVADYGRHTILRHSGSASPFVAPTVFAGHSSFYGSQDGPALLNATFTNPNSVFAYTDGNGNMAVLVTDKNTIRRIAVAGPTPSPSLTTTRSHTLSHTFSNTATMPTDSYGPTSASATIQSRSVSRTLSPTASPTASHTPTRTASKTESHVTQSVSVSRTLVTRTCLVSSTPSRFQSPSMSEPVYSVTTTGSCAAPFRLDPLGTTDAAAASLCVAVGRQHHNDSGGALPSCVGLNATADNNAATYPSLNNSTSSGAAVVVVVAPPNTEQLPPATGAFPLRVAVLLSVPAEWKMVTSGSKGGATIVALPPPHATPGTTQLWFTAVLAEQPAPGSVTRWMLAATCSLAVVPVEFSLTWPTATSSTTASTATAVTQATSGMVALASVGTGSGLSSAVSLAMMSLLSCSGQPPGLSSTAYVISVFFDLGFTATAFGNIGLAATATLVHLLVQASVAAFQGRKLFDDQLAYLRFPALSLIGCEFLIPGAVFGAAASLVASGSGEVAAGVIALLLVAAAVVGAHMLSMRHVLPQMTFAAYALYPTGHVWEQTFLFPDGHWLPAPLRTRFKPLVGHTVARWWWLRVGDVLLAASLAIVTGLTIGGLSSACVLAPVVGGLYLVYALVLVVVRPYRCPMDNVCSPLVHVLFGVVCMLKFADLDAPATYVQVALSVVQLWKALVSLWVGCREAQWGSDNCSSTTDPKGQKLEPPSLMEVIEDGGEDALELVDVAQHKTAQHDAGPHNSDRRDVPMNAEAGGTLPAAVCIDVATPEATSAQLTGGNRVRADGDDEGILPVVGGDLEGYNALFWDRSGNALTAAAQQQRPIGLRPALHGDMLAAFYDT